MAKVGLIRQFLYILVLALFSCVFLVSYHLTTTLTNPILFDLLDHQPTPYMVVVLSAAGNRQRREKLRAYGWLSHAWISHSTGARIPYRYVFVCGRDAQHDLAEEVEQHGDLVVWPGPETYPNIVNKVAWILAKLQRDGHNFNFLVKTDDDSFVNISNLERVLAGVSPSELWYGGECIHNKTVYRHGKFAVSRFDYPAPRYPSYAAGAGYVVSAALTWRLTAEMWRVQQFPVEDAYVGVVSSLVGGSVRCVPGFYHQHWRGYPGRVGDAVVLHYVQIEEIQLLGEMVWRQDTGDSVWDDKSVSFITGAPSEQQI